VRFGGEAARDSGLVRRRAPETSGDLTIAYNGEVYNFREVRRELEAHGARFSSGSDTGDRVAAVSELPTVGTAFDAPVLLAGQTVTRKRV
jgi:asparagine synthetase B (glutamine-hydrolysing)